MMVLAGLAPIRWPQSFWIAQLASHRGHLRNESPKKIVSRC